MSKPKTSMMACRILAFLVCLSSPALVSAEPDPADEMDPNRPLSADERVRVERLFARLASVAFDEREEAREALIAIGPRAIGVAKRFEDSDSYEVRSFARRIQEHVLLKYKGYLPTSARIEALFEERHRIFIGRQEPFPEAFRRFTLTTGLHVLFDGGKLPQRVIGTDETLELNMNTGEALKKLVSAVGMTAIVRGRSVIVTTAARARELHLQTHRFRFSTTEKHRDQLDRLAESLRACLPRDSAVRFVRGGVEIRSTESGLRLAARALHLLRKKMTGPVCWPAANEPENLDGLRKALEKPVAHFVIAGRGPLRGLIRLRSDGHPVAVDPVSTLLSNKQPAVSLDLTAVPLGLCLRWLRARVRRAAVIQRSSARLEYDLDWAERRVVARLISADEREPAGEVTVGGTTVDFLFGGDPGKKADDAVLVRLKKALDDQLDMLPDGMHTIVIHSGNAVICGSAERVAVALRLLGQWRSGNPPPATEWRRRILKKLDRPVDWDGAGMTAQTLLSRLRDTCGVNVLLDHGMKGQPPKLELEANEAGLLPTGKYTARKIIDRLCVLTGCSWSVHWGAVILAPLKDARSEASDGF